MRRGDGTAKFPSRRGPIALTGTPGVGKSTVARLLAAQFRCVEVAALARSLGLAFGRGRSVTVDLLALQRRLRRHPELAGADVLVGHLAHLLPVREAIVLRCRPSELERRLTRAHRGTARTRRENAVCEATDTIVFEVGDAGVPWVEVDTTGRSPRAVALEVARLLAGGRPGRGKRVDWLSDRRVTAHLLEPSA